MAGKKRGLHVPSTWTTRNFNFIPGDQVTNITTVLHSLYHRFHWGTHDFPEGVIPSLESCRLLHTALRSNPFWLVALRYCLFPIKSIIWVIFIINSRRLELSGLVVVKLFEHVD